MKWSVTALIAALVASASVSAIDLAAFGPRALQNLNQTPACAQLCIFNPKWARTYAPECADLPLGKEYATKLCENYMYQHMLDSCFKDKCTDGERQKVFSAPDCVDIIGSRLGQGYLCQFRCGCADAALVKRGKGYLVFNTFWTVFDDYSLHGPLKFSALYCHCHLL